jgi:hypothetical protein
MNAQEQVSQEDQAQQIWNQLDAEDAGQAPVDNAELPGGGDVEIIDDQDDSTPAGDPADDEGGGDDGVDEGTPEQALMDKIAGLEQMLGQVTTRLRNAEGHIGGLGSQLKQQVQAAQQVTAKGGEAPTAGEIRAAQQNPAAMEDLKRDYPEFATAMESALNERLQQLEQRFQAQAPAQQAGVQQTDITRLRAEIQVDVQHPGWQETVQTPEFVGWLTRQPREVQMLAASDSPQDAVRLLDLHEEATTQGPSQQQQRLRSAAAIPSGRSGSSVRTKAIEDMTPQEYWRYLDQLDKQKA